MESKTASRPSAQALVRNADQLHVLCRCAKAQSQGLSHLAPLCLVMEEGADVGEPKANAARDGLAGVAAVEEAVGVSAHPAGGHMLATLRHSAEQPAEEVCCKVMELTPAQQNVFSRSREE